MSFAHLPGRRRALAALAAAPLLAAGCGFQLRGPRPLPFDTIYLGMYEYSELAAAIRRQIQAGSSTRVVTRPEEAAVRLEVLADAKEKFILALNTQGRVREYQLRHRFSFRLVDKNGQEIIAPNEILLRRDLAFDDSQVLAKEQEEILLYRDMQGDLVQQLMRRLSAARMPDAPPKP
ncbi:MAG: LPS assembly lipoprotein LptE [Zoogloea sp.]|uniref:LPS-assembly lipoprotein LptE n=1 Tax=Zoogloea sp. TaxID=49181 RepID=UPI0026063A4F|nr:LPS assembly lipoprotein LptE [Zoogloea sp.]MDD2990591.1 LPS assembly lipoprotein LptE [Zoogloea sp.]